MNLPAPRKLLLSILSLSCLFNLAIQESHASLKRRVAIMPFTYGAVSSELGTTDVGKGITTLLITKIVNDGTYSVVDREMLDSILKEQNLSVSDRADPATACKIGKILSVDAIIVGTVTQFGFETKSANVGGLAGIGTSYIPVVGGLGSFGLGSVGVKKSKARVAVDARIIDINTTEILGAVHGAGESKRTGTALFAGVGPEWGSDNFAATIAGEATLQAVDAIGSQLIALSAKIPDNQSIAAANVSGKVADVTGSQVIVNIGKSNGIAVGDNLQIDRAYKTIKDPVTGKVLKELNKTIAVVTVSDLDNATATGNITKGAGVQVGDNVRKVTMSVSAVIVEAPPSDSGKLAASSQTPKKTSK
jgi:curli biogenesis system outer membrane secretion channel CsgG